MPLNRLRHKYFGAKAIGANVHQSGADKGIEACNRLLVSKVGIGLVFMHFERDSSRHISALSGGRGRD